jgi:hypothetical protein
LQKQLKELVEANRSITSLSMEEFWGYLCLAFANLLGRVFCVADTLDEMDGGNDEGMVGNQVGRRKHRQKEHNAIAYCC